MPEAKTKLNDASVSNFLNKIPDQQLRADCYTLVDIMQSAAKATPRMWGSSIIGFGEHNIVYAGGRQSAWMLIGFAPRKQNIALYIGSSFPEHDELLTTLGKHSTGKGCLYIKKLSDVHLPTLEKMVSASVNHKLKPSATASNSNPIAATNVKPSAASNSKPGAVSNSKPRSKSRSLATSKASSPKSALSKSVSSKSGSSKSSSSKSSSKTKTPPRSKPKPRSKTRKA